MLSVLVLAGCGPSLGTPEPSKLGPPAGDASPTSPAGPNAQCSVIDGVSPVVIAAAPDVQHLTALTLDRDYVYFTGGTIVPVSPGSPAGSDTRGVLRRAPMVGGTVEQVWTGQGVGYAVVPTQTGMSFVTYDYASTGRTGTVHNLKTDGSLQALGEWRSQGSCIGLASDGASTFWSFSAGSTGEVRRTDSNGSTQAVAIGESTCSGKLRVRGTDLIWLGGTRSRKYPRWAVPSPVRRSGLASRRWVRPHGRRSSWSVRMTRSSQSMPRR